MTAKPYGRDARGFTSKFVGKLGVSIRRIVVARSCAGVMTYERNFMNWRSALVRPELSVVAAVAVVAAGVGLVTVSSPAQAANVTTTSCSPTPTPTPTHSTPTPTPTPTPSPTQTTPTPTPTATPTVTPSSAPATPAAVAIVPLVASTACPPPKPAQGVSVTVLPLSGKTVGIAYPITVNFSHDVQHKQLAEENMRVYVNGKLSSGAWMWQSNSSAMFRQKGFWPGHATIKVAFTLKGVDLYESKQFRYIGRQSTTRTYVLHTARALVAKVNALTDRMKIYIDGHLVKNFPVSLGKKGFETRSGIKAVAEKYPTRHMSSILAGITDPNDQYDLIAPWAVRLTWSGEFVHGAPWAKFRIGKFNGSHGCTNLLADDAKWFYDHTTTGDPVVTTGTNRPMESSNSIGGPYNVAWSTWLAHSKLKGHWPVVK